jgi:hypothetical protein
MLFAIYELVVGTGVVAFRGVVGFVFACGLLVACTGFLAALSRAVQQSVPCACFGRLGRTAAGGREIGRAIALVAGAGFLVVHRAVDPNAGYGVGPVAVLTFVAMASAIVAAQRIGAAVRPGVELDESARASILSVVRETTGYDNDLYSLGS